MPQIIGKALFLTLYLRNRPLHQGRDPEPGGAAQQPQPGMVSDLLADLDHWAGRLTPGSYSSDDLLFWLVAKLPRELWDECRSTAERKARALNYEDLCVLLLELALEKESDQHLNAYRDWGTVPDPLGDEALPLVVEVYGCLSWASSGTTRGMRNGPFDAVLLQRDGGNQEVPPGGWVAPKDHERVLRSVIWAAWPDRGPKWPAFHEGGAVLRITDADANNWLPRALRNTLTHWRYRRRNPPPPQPEPPHKRRRM